jgi:hypothetical protein
MKLTPQDVRAIHSIAQALIKTLEDQLISKGITEGNIAIDATIISLCYAMLGAGGDLENDELLRRVKLYYDAMNLHGAPGKQDGGDDS